MVFVGTALYVPVADKVFRLPKGQYSLGRVCMSPQFMLAALEGCDKLNFRNQRESAGDTKNFWYEAAGSWCSALI